MIRLSSPSELGLNIQPSLTWNKQHVTIVIYKRLLFHRRVCCIYMDCEAFSKSRIAIARKRLQPIHKICFSSWDIKWMPSKLGRAEVNFWIGGKEVGFELLVSVRRHARQSLQQH